MPANTPKLRTRKPTGNVPWPLILVEGGEKSGKSWTCAEFTADERLGQAYWLDLGEGAADEYAAIDGADYLVLEHDGTYLSILEQVQAVHAEAARAIAAGEKPVVLIVDSMTNEWDLLKDWVTARARNSNAGKRALQRDPDAEVKPSNGLWNDANTRHYRIMHLLMQFPGIAVITARGKEVAVIGADGNPVAGQKDWKVEGQKNLGFDSSAWVRLSRDEAPKVVGVRSVHAGIRPGVDRPRRSPEFTLAWLVFDVLRCDPATAQVRDMRALDSTPDNPPAQPADEPSARDQFREQIGVNAETSEQDAAAAAAALEQRIGQATTREQCLGLFADAGKIPGHAQRLQRAVTERAQKIAAGAESAEAPAAA